MNRILVVEDEKNIRESVELALSEKYSVKTAASAEEAYKHISAEHFDMLITDIKLPGKNGIELLEDFKNYYPDSPVIVMTAFSSISSAVQAMKAGADEYVPKPFSLDELEIKIKNLLEAKRNKEEKTFYMEEKDNLFGDIIGMSTAMKKIKAEIKKVAKSDITVLINGDTGTGKELLAYTIHRLSGKTGPFVPVHCAAYAKGIIESELFGHEKGSFTGADKQRKGKVEFAENGTLFIDELGDIPVDIQIKLLRLIENRAFERVGSNNSIKTNTRIICATNRNLEEMIKKGEFRQDLFYRVNVFPITIPPLKDRKEDIISLASYFLSKADKDKLIIDDLNKTLLTGYNWPGNVRELQNIVERAVILSEGNALRADLALGKNTEIKTNDESVSVDLSGELGLSELIDQIEKDIILKALKMNKYNHSKTAKQLKLNRTTLQYKVQKYGFKEEE